MKQVVHHGYAIMVTAYNEKNVWRAHVIITWDGEKFEIQDEASFTTQSKAEEHGIELGEHWVNNRLQTKQGPT